MPGATGTIAARTIARAAPDGYTVMISSVSTHSANAYLYNISAMIRSPTSRRSR